MEPFTGQLFKGMLAFFLLDMGIATANRMADLRNVPKQLPSRPGRHGPSAGAPKDSP